MGGESIFSLFLTNGIPNKFDLSLGNPSGYKLVSSKISMEPIKLSILSPSSSESFCFSSTSASLGSLISESS